MGQVTGWESDTPRGRALVLFKVLRGHTEYNDDLVETIYRCCLCGVCQAWCKGGYTPPEAVLLARRDIVKLGKDPQPARQIKQNILETGNPFGLPRDDRFAAIEHQGRLTDNNATKKAAEVVYYVGCDTAYHQPEIANAFVRILAHAGADFAVLRDEISSGKPLTALGYHKEAQQVAQTLAAAIKATGCRTIVTACPSSFDAFKNDYPAMGVDLGDVEVLHASQYLDRLLKEGKLSPNVRLDRAAAVLDSDRLGRFNGIFDEPRRLLQAIPGVELKEMSWTRELAHSCGETAGVLRLLYPELSQLLAQRVLAEAVDSGVQLLATSCPVSKQTLMETAEPGVEIRDVVQLIAQSIE